MLLAKSSPAHSCDGPTLVDMASGESCLSIYSLLWLSGEHKRSSLGLQLPFRFHGLPQIYTSSWANPEHSFPLQFQAWPYPDSPPACATLCDLTLKSASLPWLQDQS